MKKTVPQGPLQAARVLVISFQPTDLRNAGVRQCWTTGYPIGISYATTL